MDGLYALKPWYAARLTPLRRRLIAAGVAPSTVSAAGVGCAAGAAATLALVPPGALAGVLVGVALAARLACANLDGAIARATGGSTPRGAVVNELSDRAADLLSVFACCALASVPLVVAVALCALLPSMVSMAGVAAGLARRQGGPMGKTERATLLVVVGATGSALPLVAIAFGSVLTAALRLRWVSRQLPGGAA
jgi:CDP-diacylglycerol--glycerol-3-phosphate 3-phosphatidyltransferase